MILQTLDLTLQYPGKLLCRNLSLTVGPGECWAILGQNGCGKTTLIHALGGLRRVDRENESSVMVAGKPPQTWPRRELARNLGILLQEEPGEFWGSVSEYVLLGRYPHVKNIFGWDAIDQDMALHAIERMELTSLAHRPLITLSGGERQRARIALLLAQSPICYLLDEPLQHLDLRHQLLAMTLFGELARQGSAVVMVLHDIGWASRFCDHVLMLFDDGHTIRGSSEETLNQSNLEALYQCNIKEIVMNNGRHFVPETMPGV
ncbi:ABC transporter ATP-binding protein [Nitrosospira lacus]|uniref:ABC transporter n=1 Tax=Nitrosospira lacus TaxID=1288494 RepID=A0A1W6SNW7_9PROT|nr:ABC transporter ATP-binding protein [Nitrosospira lacus]ARO87471.1 ABC transporter ATP-binding protein [Nitrosospira lacus]